MITTELDKVLVTFQKTLCGTEPEVIEKALNNINNPCIDDLNKTKEETTQSFHRT